uniref:Uncharacterized protein n=1 Tax=Marseillevirus LCMAC103 TaxID=2506604 RepID=A0A481YVS0_9VIRU|nr:MAG: hypothetical protein LCMAC103_02330 [Marseillevirus LCMAC103]
MESPEHRAQEIQNRYLNEYKNFLFSIPPAEAAQNLKQDTQKWNRDILGLPLQEQREYADFVTRKVCAEQPQDILRTILDKTFDVRVDLSRVNTCAIGCAAHLVATINDHTDCTVDVKDAYIKQFDTWLGAIQRSRGDCPFTPNPRASASDREWVERVQQWQESVQ